MRIKIFPRLGEPPIELEASLIVVEGEHGQPVAVAQDCGQGRIEYSDARDPEHNRVLRQLGIDKLVEIESLDRQIVTPSSQSQLGKLPLIMGDY